MLFRLALTDRLINGGCRFSLSLENRLECLTLAVGNAKSHPVSTGGRYETAIGFLDSLEEKLEVAQVQLEIYNTLAPHVNDAPEVGERIKSLSTRLFTMQEVGPPVDYTFLAKTPSAVPRLCNPFRHA
jgi:hypothetical protein